MQSFVINNQLLRYYGIEYTISFLQQIAGGLEPVYMYIMHFTFELLILVGNLYHAKFGEKCSENMSAFFVVKDHIITETSVIPLEILCYRPTSNLNILRTEGDFSKI